MYLLHLILLPILALVAVVYGTPTPGDIPANTEHETVNASPHWCGHIYKGVYSRYILRGREWGVHEKILMDAVVKSQPACYMTNWRYREETRDSGLVDFDLIFHMPLLCQKRFQRSFNKYLGFKDAGKGGVYCPEVKDSRELEALREELGPRRKHDKWTDDDKDGS